MKDRMKRSVSFAAAALVLCAVAAGVPHGWAQRPGGGTAGTFDPLGRLKRALSEAGAAALTSAQEDKINSLITVKEFVTPADPTMLFYATADKQTNQKTAPYTPCGWGETLLVALSECIRAIHRFPYEG